MCRPTSKQFNRIAVINNATSTRPKAPAAATLRKHKLPLAVSLSILFHLGLILPAWYFMAPEKASSLGSNRIILLQSSQLKPTPSKHKITQSAQTKATGQETEQQEKPQSKGRGLQQKKTSSEKQASKNQTAKIKQITSNQGSQVNQSGKSLTPAQNYKILVQQHILKHIKNAPYFGKAHLNLGMMASGMAIKIKVEILEGPKAYGEWLKRTVYTANPFPKVPKALSNKGLHFIDVTLQHKQDQSN